MVRETRHLRVGNLPSEIDLQRVWDYFKRFGRVQSVKLLSQNHDGETNDASAIVAFVDIKSAIKAHCALEHILGEHNLKTDYYEPNCSSSPITQHQSVGLLSHISTVESSSHAHERDSCQRINNYSSASVVPIPKSPRYISGCNEHISSHFFGKESSGKRLASVVCHDSQYKKKSNDKNRSSNVSRSTLERSSSSQFNSHNYETCSNYVPSQNIEEPCINITFRTNHSSEDLSQSLLAEKNAKKNLTKEGSLCERERSKSGSISDSPSVNLVRSNGSSPRSSRSSSVKSRSLSRSPSHIRKECSHGSISFHISRYKDEIDKFYNAISVRNLPARSSDTRVKEGLYHEFKKCGKVTSVKIFGQDIERYGLVTFKRHEDAEKALNLLQDKAFFGVKLELTPHVKCDANEPELYDDDVDEYHPKASRILFIGNLSRHVSSNELRKVFEGFGAIIDIIIQKSSSGSHAFIQYSDINSVVKAMKEMDGQCLGHSLLKLGFGKSVPSSCLWVYGVAGRQFSHYGPVCYTIIDRNKGEALIFFEQVLGAQKAIVEMRGRSLGGTRLQVDFASRECQEIFFDRLQHIFCEKWDRDFSSARSYSRCIDQRRLWSSANGNTYPLGRKLTYSEAYSERSNRNYDEYSQSSTTSFDDSYDAELREYGYCQRERRGYDNHSSRGLSSSPNEHNKHALSPTHDNKRISAHDREQISSPSLEKLVQETQVLKKRTNENISKESNLGFKNGVNSIDSEKQVKSKVEIDRSKFRKYNVLDEAAEIQFVSNTCKNKEINSINICDGNVSILTDSVKEIKRNVLNSVESVRCDGDLSPNHNVIPGLLSSQINYVGGNIILKECINIPNVKDTNSMLESTSDKVKGVELCKSVEVRQLNLEHIMTPLSPNQVCVDMKNENINKLHESLSSWDSLPNDTKLCSNTLKLPEAIKNRERRVSEDSKPGTPLFDENPPDFQMEPRRTKKLSEGPIFLPLPLFAQNMAFQPSPVSRICSLHSVSSPSQSVHSVISSSHLPISISVLQGNVSHSPNLIPTKDESCQITTTTWSPKVDTLTKPLELSSDSDNSPTLSPSVSLLEDQIRILDEKYEKWSGVARSSLQTSNEILSKSCIHNLRQKYKIIDLDELRNHPSDILKELLARKSIFDEDFKRLENINEKYSVSEPASDKNNAIFQTNFMDSSNTVHSRIANVVSWTYEDGGMHKTISQKSLVNSSVPSFHSKQPLPNSTSRSNFSNLCLKQSTADFDSGVSQFSVSPASLNTYQPSSSRLPAPSTTTLKIRRPSDSSRSHTNDRDSSSPPTLTKSETSAISPRIKPQVASWVLSLPTPFFKKENKTELKSAHSKERYSKEKYLASQYESKDVKLSKKENADKSGVEIKRSFPNVDSNKNVCMDVKRESQESNHNIRKLSIIPSESNIDKHIAMIKVEKISKEKNSLERECLKKGSEKEVLDNSTKKLKRENDAMKNNAALKRKSESNEAEKKLEKSKTDYSKEVEIKKIKCSYQSIDSYKEKIHHRNDLISEKKEPKEKHRTGSTEIEDKSDIKKLDDEKCKEELKSDKNKNLNEQKHEKKRCNDALKKTSENIKNNSSTCKEENLFSDLKIKHFNEKIKTENNLENESLTAVIASGSNSHTEASHLHHKDSKVAKSFNENVNEIVDAKSRSINCKNKINLNSKFSELLSDKREVKPMKHGEKFKFPETSEEKHAKKKHSSLNKKYIKRSEIQNNKGLNIEDETFLRNKEIKISPEKDTDAFSKKGKIKRKKRISSDDTSDEDYQPELKKHSIFDVIIDENEPVYFSMYDKVKARSCKNLQKQKVEKKHEVVKDKFSVLKQKRAKREEKLKANSHENESDLDVSKNNNNQKQKRIYTFDSSSGDESCANYNKGSKMSKNNIKNSTHIKENKKFRKFSLSESESETVSKSNICERAQNVKNESKEENGNQTATESNSSKFMLLKQNHTKKPNLDDNHFHDSDLERNHEHIYYKSQYNGNDADDESENKIINYNCSSSNFEVLHRKIVKKRKQFKKVECQDRSRFSEVRHKYVKDKEHLTNVSLGQTEHKLDNIDSCNDKNLKTYKRKDDLEEIFGPMSDSDSCIVDKPTNIDLVQIEKPLHSSSKLQVSDIYGSDSDPTTQNRTKKKPVKSRSNELTKNVDDFNKSNKYLHLKKNALNVSKNKKDINETKDKVKETKMEDIQLNKSNQNKYIASNQTETNKIRKVSKLIFKSKQKNKVASLENPLDISLVKEVAKPISDEPVRKSTSYKVSNSSHSHGDQTLHCNSKIESSSSLTDDRNTPPSQEFLASVINTSQKFSGTTNKQPTSEQNNKVQSSYFDDVLDDSDLSQENSMNETNSNVSTLKQEFTISPSKKKDIEEVKPRTVISQEETDDAVAAILGETFHYPSFSSNFPMSVENIQDTNTDVHSNLMDDEAQQAAQILESEMPKLDTIQNQVPVEIVHVNSPDVSKDKASNLSIESKLQIQENMSELNNELYVCSSTLNLTLENSEINNEVNMKKDMVFHEAKQPDEANKHLRNIKEGAVSDLNEQSKRLALIENVSNSEDQYACDLKKHEFLIDNEDSQDKDEGQLIISETPPESCEALNINEEIEYKHEKCERTNPSELQKENTTLIHQNQNSSKELIITSKESNLVIEKSRFHSLDRNENDQKIEKIIISSETSEEPTDNFHPVESYSDQTNDFNNELDNIMVKSFVNKDLLHITEEVLKENDNILNKTLDIFEFHEADEEKKCKNVIIEDKEIETNIQMEMQKHEKSEELMNDQNGDDTDNKSTEEIDNNVDAIMCKFSANVRKSKRLQDKEGRTTVDDIIDEVIRGSKCEENYLDTCKNISVINNNDCSNYCQPLSQIVAHAISKSESYSDKFDDKKIAKHSDEAVTSFICADHNYNALGVIIENQPTSLIDPVTGILIPMKESGEGQYIPINHSEISILKGADNQGSKEPLLSEVLRISNEKSPTLSTNLDIDKQKNVDLLSKTTVINNLQLSANQNIHRPSVVQQNRSREFSNKISSGLHNPSNDKSSSFDNFTFSQDVQKFNADSVQVCSVPISQKPGKETLSSFVSNIKPEDLSSPLYKQDNNLSVYDANIRGQNRIIDVSRYISSHETCQATPPNTPPTAHQQEILRMVPNQMSPQLMSQQFIFQQYLRSPHEAIHRMPLYNLPVKEKEKYIDDDALNNRSHLSLHLRQPPTSVNSDRSSDSPIIANLYHSTRHVQRLVTPHVRSIYTDNRSISEYSSTDIALTSLAIRNHTTPATEAPPHSPILSMPAVTLPRGQMQTPPYASQVPPQADSLLMLLQRYPVMWQGLLALKNDQAAVQMHFVSGNPDVARGSLPVNSDGISPPLRIAQRMRLEQSQLEGVARKMQIEAEHCMLLALPCGHDHMDVLQQSNNLRSGFITYLQLKQAAGIVNVAMPGSQQPAYVIHIFPSCNFSNENLARIAPDLLHSVADIAHLLIIIATV